MSQLERVALALASTRTWFSPRDAPRHLCSAHRPPCRRTTPTLCTASVLSHTLGATWPIAPRPIPCVPPRPLLRYEMFSLPRCALVPTAPRTIPTNLTLSPESWYQLSAGFSDSGPSPYSPPNYVLWFEALTLPYVSRSRPPSPALPFQWRKATEDRLVRNRIERPWPCRVRSARRVLVLVSGR